MPARTWKLSLFLIPLLLAGCMRMVFRPIGIPDLNEDKLRAIRLHSTTAATVERLLGKPQSESPGENGGKVLTYHFKKGWKETVVVAVTIDGAGVATALTRSRQVLGFKLNNRLDPARFRQVEAGVTRETQLPTLLGTPVMWMENADGTKLYTYMAGNLMKSPQSLLVFVDRDGVVASVHGAQQDFRRTLWSESKKRPDPRYFSLIQVGISDETEVRKLLGEPTQRMDNQDGTRAFAYVFGERKIGGAWEIWRVVFAPQGMVICAYRSRQEFHLDKARKVVVSGRPPDPDRWRRIEPGASSEADIVEWFGQPQFILPRADGGKTYGYVHSEMPAAKSGVPLNPFLVPWKNSVHQVLFDPRGVVRHTMAPGETAPTWPPPPTVPEREWAEPLTARERVIARLGPAGRSYELADGGGAVYLWASPDGGAECRRVIYDGQGRLGATGATRWTVSELNRRGREIDRVKWERIVVGRTTLAEVEAMVGEADCRFTLADGNRVALYVLGRVEVDPSRLPGPLPLCQKYGVYELRADAAGVVTAIFEE